MREWTREWRAHELGLRFAAGSACAVQGVPGVDAGTIRCGWAGMRELRGPHLASTTAASGTRGSNEINEIRRALSSEINSRGPLASSLR